MIHFCKPVFIFILLFLAACTEENNCKPGETFNQKIMSMEMEGFSVPDSINTEFIIASYYEQERNAFNLLVYNDSMMKKAKKICYFSDTVISDDLEIIKFNEFRSADNKAEYVVNEKTVVCFNKRVGWPYTTTPMKGIAFARMDLNRRRTKKPNDLIEVK
jgi:hypothetical protein